MNKCGFTTDLCLDSIGRSGGLGLWWRDVDVSVISFSARHIKVLIKDQDKGDWAFIGIYGHPEQENKWRTCTLMRQLATGCDVPILFIGDFNLIANVSEKLGGANVRDQDIRPF